MKRMTHYLTTALALVVLTAWAGVPAPTVHALPPRGEGRRDNRPPPPFPEGPPITAESAVILSSETGRVLWGKDLNKPRPMASTTKIMTALIALEHTRPDHPNRKRLNELVIVGKNPSRITGSLMKDVNGTTNLQRGEQIRFEDLLYGLMLPSGNDAAVAIAEFIAGSEEKFVALMNRRAEELRLHATHYKNPHGLDADGHESSALDLARLARFALRDPTFAAIVRTSDRTITTAVPVGKTGTYKPRTYDLHNTNDLLKDNPYPGADGVKTGTTGSAAACLVSRVTLLGQSLIVVVLGSGRGETRAARDQRRFEDTRKLLDFGFDLLLDIARQADSGRSGAARAIDALGVSPNRVVTPVADGDGRLRLLAWAVGDTIRQEGDSGPQPETVTEVAGANVGDRLVTAVRTSAGRLKLITWGVNARGAFARLGDSGSDGPEGSQVVVRALTRSRVVTALRTAAGAIRLISWEMNQDGSWRQVADETSAEKAEAFGIASYPLDGGPDVGAPTTFRLVAALRDPLANLTLVTWDVAANGAIRQRGSARNPDRWGDEVTVFHGPLGLIPGERPSDPPRAMLITAGTNAVGNLELITWAVSPDGRTITRLAGSGTQAAAASKVRVQALTGTGLMTAVRDRAGNTKLIAWAMTVKGEVKRLADSGPTSDAAADLALVLRPGLAYVTAARTPEGDLHLAGWTAILGEPPTAANERRPGQPAREPR